MIDPSAWSIDTMTDQGLADILTRFLPHAHGGYGNEELVAAIERAIEILSPCPQCGACLNVHECHTGNELEAD